MKIIALLVANASAVMVGSYYAPHNSTNVEDVDMAVHIVERDGMETDEWIVIDTLVHGDDDDHEHQEGGWCNNIYSSMSMYSDPSTGEESNYHTF